MVLGLLGYILLGFRYWVAVKELKRSYHNVGAYGGVVGLGFNLP